MSASHAAVLSLLSLPPQIVFKSRLGPHNVGNNYTTTIDGTNFRIHQKGKAVKWNAFLSHKNAGKSELQYELGVDILVGNLVWIQGPYSTGKYTDIKIFNSVLLHNLTTTSSRVSVSRQTTGMLGTRARSSAPTTPATHRRNLQCRAGQGLVTRC